MNSHKKTAIILFNLGGPDTLRAIRPFLFNMFTDKAIIKLPWLIRLMVGLIFSYQRNKKASLIYSLLGGKSPLLNNTISQARSLEKIITNGSLVRIFIIMRYWYPFSQDVISTVKYFNPDQIILLPLYPQYSSVTTSSSVSNLINESDFVKLNKPTYKICCYFNNDGFVKSITRLIKNKLSLFKPGNLPRILFSAHGLPKSIIRKGDPYQWQCEQTVNEIVSMLNISNLDWLICYQSRVGPIEWIEPYTDKEIIRAGRDKISLLLVPISFVSENSETLVELDIEYKKLAEVSGVPFYDRISTVGTEPEFIDGLLNLINKSALYEEGYINKYEKHCPGDLVGCGYCEKL